MRGRLIVPVLCAVAATAAAATSARATTAPNPCKLVTRADAASVLGAVGPAKLQRLGLYQSCTYSTTKLVTLTVQTRPISKPDFVQSAKANPGPVKPVRGVGALAYSAAGGVTLLVWRDGAEATFSIFGGGPGLAREIELARRVVARL